MYPRLIAAAFFAMTASPALAWTATVDGPDVFGNTKGFATDGGERESLVVQCDSKDQLFVAMIMRKKEFEETATSPGTLLLQIDGAAPISLPAELRSWNDNYAGIVASGRTPEIMAVVQAIKTGKSKINAGMDISGYQYSASFSTRGSTGAMTKIIDGCKLEPIGLPPA